MSTEVTNSPLPNYTVKTHTYGGAEYQEFVKGLVTAPYDYISLSYTGSNLTGVIYKLGGSGGATVATLAIAYSGSNPTSVTKT